MITRTREAPRSTALFIALCSLALVLTGCGAGTPATPTPDATRQLTDPTGHQLTMPVTPQRALGFYTTDVDILITLGIPLAPLQPIRGDSGYTTFPAFFPAEALAGVSTFANYPEYNYEKVLEAEPDFILNGLGYDAKTVDRLPEIAPTYSVNAYDGQDWRVHFKKTAEDLGRTTQYEAWTAAYDASVTKAKADIAASPAKDWTVAAISYWDGAVQLGCYGVECHTLKDDLGLSVHPLMNQAEAQLSAEQLGQLTNVDAVFMSKGVGEQGDKEFEQMMTELNKIPTWRELPFVQNHRIFTYEMEMTYGSPSGQTSYLEMVRSALVNGQDQ